MDNSKFHKHLDICKRCESQPFDLCPEGSKILINEVEEIEKDNPDIFQNLRKCGTSS
jgi:hypothetical protein